MSKNSLRLSFLTFSNVAYPIILALLYSIANINSRSNLEAFSWLCKCLKWDQNNGAIIVSLLIFVWRDLIARSAIAYILAIIIDIYAWMIIVVRIDCDQTTLWYCSLFSLALLITTTALLIYDRYRNRLNDVDRFRNFFQANGFKYFVPGILKSAVLIVVFEAIFSAAASGLKKYREYNKMSISYNEASDSCFYGKIYGCGIDIKLLPQPENSFCIQADEDSVGGMWELVSEKKPTAKGIISAYINGKEKKLSTEADTSRDVRDYAIEGLPTLSNDSCFRIIGESNISLTKKQMYCVSFPRNQNLGGEGYIHFYAYVGAKRFMLK